MAMSNDRAIMVGEAKGMHKVCISRENRTIQDLKRLDLARAYTDLMRELYELWTNNRLKDVTFAKRLIAIREKFQALEEATKPLLQQFDHAEMMSHHDEVTIIKEATPSPSPALQVKEPKEEGQVTLKLSRGGKRAGAGRKGYGRTEKVSISLPDEEWAYIDGLVRDHHVKSRSEYFRLLHMSSRFPTEFLAPLPPS